MVIEKTVIRDAKGSSGIVGLTRKTPTLIRWSLMRLIVSDYMKVMRERSDSSKRTEDSDHKEVLTFTLRSVEEHARAVTKHAVNNTASSFELNAHPYVLSNLFIRLHAKVDLHNSLLESISAGEEKRERFAELGYQLEVQIEMVSEPPQGTTTMTVHISNAMDDIQKVAGEGMI